MYTAVTLPVSLGTKNNGQSKSFLTRFHVIIWDLFSWWFLDGFDPMFHHHQRENVFWTFSKHPSCLAGLGLLHLGGTPKRRMENDGNGRVKNLVQKCHEMTGNKANPSSFSSKCPKLGGGNSNTDFMFIPIWGNDQIWLKIFQMGWFNHQLEHVQKIMLNFIK